MDLTADELKVLDKYRKARSMVSARIFISLDHGVITQLDVTEKETRKSLAQMNGGVRLREGLDNHR